MTKAKPKIATFKADAALIRELGERLVGQPHIALAELVKNAYDADASRCFVTVGNDEISVVDDGHGMTSREFQSYWMTIGTRHKERLKGKSRNLNRNLTGSKGVGRLAVQFLAHELEMTTVSERSENRQLVVSVNWDEAIKAGSLFQAKAEYRTAARQETFAEGSHRGTKVVMRNLKQTWDDNAIRDLGRELWMLQSPMSNYGDLLTDRTDPDDFLVQIRSTDGILEKTFADQTQAALENYIALIDGEIRRKGKRSEVLVSVSFRDGEKHVERFTVKPLIESANWRIRIFNLKGHQSKKISVSDARKYFAKYGGVKVYDAGFRLPYYGVAQDWLGIEFDHSHRKNRSELLPERLQVKRALNDLPSQGRLFGVVDIDTGYESRKATREQKSNGDILKIQVTRDRLVSNGAYEELHRAVRWSLDFYATRQRIREGKKIDVSGPTESPERVLQKVRSLAQELKSAYPHDDRAITLVEECDELAETIRMERTADESTKILLGPLAAAGMAALALEHEAGRDIRRARSLLRALRRIAKARDDVEIQQLVQRVSNWIKRADQSRQVFAPLLDRDDREEVDVLAALDVIEQVVDNVKALVPNMNITTKIGRDLYLPPASFAEWSSLFQNVLINASNATLDVDDGQVACIGGRTGRSSWVRVNDNGVGVNVDTAEELFEPFERRTEISEARRELGLGGTGLGLTIVRMIAKQRGAKVEFRKPDSCWSTTFQLSWASMK
ncbi:MAG: ATP-binding protein [Gammaproteobacteria bacterium]|nr:ATP-binding protein [Gammaproteobacteria bacterium]